MTVTPGKFKMFAPARSHHGHVIVGALVGADQALTYTRRLRPSATRDDLRRAYGELREEIHRDHPGIKEEFTVLRPRVGYN